MHQIVPLNLWLGNAADARAVRRMLDDGILAVIDLALEELPAQLPRDVLYCRIPLTDGSGNEAHVIRAAVDITSALVKSKTPTLVACGAGMSRSPAIVAAAISQMEGIALDDALARVTAGMPHDVSTSLWAAIKSACALH